MLPSNYWCTRPRRITDFFAYEILHEFLSTPMVSLKIEDLHLYKEYEEDKLFILDILAIL